MPEKDLGRILNLAHGIFVMNSADRDLLLSFGVRKEKIDIVYAGADPEMFKILDSKSEKEKKTIGFCLRYERYPEYTGRKNHDLVIDLIKEVREHNVILLGKNWRSFERFKEIESLEYFTYIETEYENYCHYYNMMDIFLSISKLEGGPVPLIEAMFCGVFPIVTKTGFAPDLINERNGILLPIDSKRDDILKTIYSAKLISREEVRMSVDKLTWSNFGKKIVSTIENSLLN
jgi:glycosyltransferase involved in cell wall biosynthesis